MRPICKRSHAVAASIAPLLKRLSISCKNSALTRWANWLFQVRSLPEEWGLCPQTPEVLRIESKVDEPRQKDKTPGPFGTGAIVGQWLNLRDLGRSRCASAELYPALTGRRVGIPVQEIQALKRIR